MSVEMGFMFFLMTLLCVLMLVVFLSLYSSSLKKNGRKKIIEVNLEVQTYYIRSIDPAIKGKKITLTGDGVRLRFIVDDDYNPGYRVGQRVMVAMTENGPRLLNDTASQSHILYQTGRV